LDIAPIAAQYDGQRPPASLIIIVRSAIGADSVDRQGARRQHGGRSTMMKARMLVLASLAWGTASLASAQEPVQLKFSRVVDLTLPIESNMAGIPGLRDYAENPSRVAFH
jgi:hypothetical protein